MLRAENSSNYSIRGFGWDGIKREETARPISYT